jgi:hypothetical protein
MNRVPPKEEDMRKASPALVISIIALFVALGGAGMAATGGNFILGKANSATSTTSLAASVAGKALQVSNASTATGATALGLYATSGHAPFTVNTGIKVANLNADRVDGRDANYFLPATGTAANASNLGGQPASYYLPVAGSVRGWTYAIAQLTLTAPSDGSQTASCPTGDYVLGGGWSVATGDDPDFEIKQSAPTGPPLNGWNVIARNNGTNHTITAYVWAICANVS